MRSVKDWLNILKDCIKVFFPMVILTACLYAGVWGINYWAGNQGLIFQYGFLRAILFLGSVVIGVYTCMRLLRIPLRSKLKKWNLAIACIAFIMTVQMTGNYYVPTDEYMYGDMITQVYGSDEKGFDLYKYYDKEKIFFKREFQWDEEHELRLLEDQFQQKFVLNPDSSSDARRYIAESIPDQNIEIGAYPNSVDKEATIITYSSTGLIVAAEGEKIVNPNDFAVTVYFASQNSDEKYEVFLLPNAQAELAVLDKSKRYLVGVIQNNLKADAVKLRRIEEDSSNRTDFVIDVLKE